MKTAFTRIALATACMAFAGQLLAAEPKRPESEVSPKNILEIQLLIT
jgi:hypothetical protein